MKSEAFTFHFFPPGSLARLLLVQYYLEPPVRLREALQLKGLKPESFFTLSHGESRLLASQEDVFE